MYVINGMSQYCICVDQRCFLCSDVTSSCEFSTWIGWGTAGKGGTSDGSEAGGTSSAGGGGGSDGGGGGGGGKVVGGGAKA